MRNEMEKDQRNMMEKYGEYSGKESARRRGKMPPGSFDGGTQLWEEDMSRGENGGGPSIIQ